MKKVLKYILLGFAYLIGIAFIIICSPIILTLYLSQLITQPFEKKKFYSSGFDKFAHYFWGITHSVSYHVFEKIKQYPFVLIENAFAALDLYIFEKENEINFVLCDSFD